MQILIAFISGLIFGVGLILSGMTNPAKVIGFLDFAGAWDMSLAFVMGGAILVGLIAFHIAAKRPKALLGDVMRLPTATQIDRRLIGGALVFGVGWGLAGYCPGPAFTSLLSGSGKPVIFLVAMFAGMGIFEIQDRLARRKPRHNRKGYNI
jgi:uncharacterized membrane protein YedE/YeeE